MKVRLIIELQTASALELISNIVNIPLVFAVIVELVAKL